MNEHERILRTLDEINSRLGEVRTAVERLHRAAMPSETIDLDTGLPHLPDELPLFPATSEVLEIMGGEETGEFPDCCAVGNDVEYYCSGTLIAPKIVVSADHCSNCTRVFLKGNDVGNPERGEVLRVREAYSHPEVDLKVLVLDQASSVEPRHVAQGDEIGEPKIATLVGFGNIDQWGSMGYGRKRRVEVPIASLDCGAPGEAKAYGCMRGREIVAGHLGLKKDSCTGDSGGPLYVQVSGGAYYLLGATSRGAKNSKHDCGDGGVYVRVDLCLDWIRQTTGLEIEGPLGTAP